MQPCRRRPNSADSLASSLWLDFPALLCPLAFRHIYHSMACVPTTRTLLERTLRAHAILHYSTYLGSMMRRTASLGSTPTRSSYALTSASRGPSSLS